MTGGSAYSVAGYFNSFRLVRVEGRQLVHRSFEFDPRSPEHAWAAKGGARSVPFDERPPELGQAAVPESAAEGLDALRRAAIADARCFIDLKSRQIKPRGTLPEPIPMLVAARVSSHQDRYDDAGRLRTERREVHLLPLEDMVQLARPRCCSATSGAAKARLRHGSSSTSWSVPKASFLIPARSLQLPTSCTAGRADSLQPISLQSGRPARPVGRSPGASVPQRGYMARHRRPRRGVAGDGRRAPASARHAYRMLVQHTSS